MDYSITRDILAYHGIITDSYISEENFPRHKKAVDEVIRSVKEEYPNLNIPEEVLIWESSSVNALFINTFVDDKAILVSRGALEAGTPEEIAAVVAHELGHLVGKHDLKAIYKMTPLSSLIQQRAECAADHFAAHYGGAEELISFLQLDGMPHPDKNFLSDILPGFDGSTHPELEERLAALKNPDIVSSEVGDINFHADCTPRIVPDRASGRKMR